MTTASRNALPVPGRKLDSLQALRAVAAMMVVLFHLHVYTIPVVLDHPERLWSGFAMGYSGVEIFFVLSGFIMAFVHREHFGRSKFALAFIARRIERICPLLWVVLIALITLRYLNGDGLPSLGEMIRAFTLFPSAGEPILEPTWSLTFEMLFYLVFSLLIFNFRFGMYVAGIWFCACLVAAVSAYQGWGASLLLSYYNILFAFGILASALFRLLSTAVAAAALFGGIGVYLLIGLGEVYGVITLPKGLRTIGFGLGATGIVAGLAALDTAGKLVTPRILLAVGDASYAIYLVHVMVMTVLVKALSQFGESIVANLPLTALVLVTGSLLSGALLHFLLERPLLRKLRTLRLQLA